MIATRQVTRQRLDRLMLERGLAPSRERAQALILSGRVMVEGQAAPKPGTRLAPGAVITVLEDPRPYASRGGAKLEGALEAFGLDVSGLTALDIGASTGGFTDCLLKRGAARVYSIDVGHGQLDWRLRKDPRVIALEGVNARYLSRDELPGLGEGADVVTVDVSFISVGLVLPRIPPLMKGGSVVALVKPQFEVGRGRVGRGGIVRDPALHREVLRTAVSRAAELEMVVAGIARSPITGAEGNIEFFLHLRVGAQRGLSPAEIDRVVDDVTSLGAEDPS